MDESLFPPNSFLLLVLQRLGKDNGSSKGFTEERQFLLTHIGPEKSLAYNNFTVPPYCHSGLHVGHVIRDTVHWLLSIPLLATTL